MMNLEPSHVTVAREALHRGWVARHFAACALRLSDRDIEQCLQVGAIGITQRTGKIGSSGVDLHVDLDTIHGNEAEGWKPSEPHLLRPGVTVCAMTAEQIRLQRPYVGYLETRGSTARSGLLVTVRPDKRPRLGVGDLHASFNGPLPITVRNTHSKDVAIQPVGHDAVCQLILGQLLVEHTFLSRTRQRVRRIAQEIGHAAAMMIPHRRLWSGGKAREGDTIFLEKL